MDKMRIRINKPGILSTLQDMGRHLYLSQAVPVSGALDTLSARMANMCLGNNDGAAVIEFTYAGAEFKAETDMLLAYAGNGALLKSNNAILPAERPVFIPKGNTMSLINDQTGSRTYLAVAGGWDVPEILGSRSTYIPAEIGGFAGRALQPDDILSSCKDISTTSRNILDNLKGDTVNQADWSLKSSMLLPENRKIIRVVPAHEFTWFEGNSLIDFLSTPYTLSMQSNRMGCHLEGTKISRLIKKELLSTAVTPGTIQVTGNGSMILLMADCQTTGGYPRIAQVAAVDMALCGQLKPGDTINFTGISRQEAEMLYIEREKKLTMLKEAIQRKYM
jgi:antagonist of KipI